jgi:CSLREA domain-containing protein
MNRNLNFLYAALLIALSLAALVHIRPAYAVGYVVNSLADTVADDGACTLREAILAANNAIANDDCAVGSSGNDTIAFSVSGTIVLGSTLPTIVSGAGTLTIDGGGNITVSGNNSVRVMVVNNGANLTLQNLTIANGKVSSVSGGGITNNGTLTVTNSTFSGNRAGYGGGIYNASSGTLTVTNSTFSGNRAVFGGGIYNDGGTLTVTGSTFSSNSGTITAFDIGGGIYNASSGTLTVTNSTFSSNFASADGGGIYNAGTLTVTNSTFSGNSVGYRGGSIYNDSGTLTVTNSTFSGNSAYLGGGIYNNGGTLTVTGSTFSGNSSPSQGGGGIYNFSSGTLTVTGSTFSNNSAYFGGGGILNYGTLTVTNSTFSGNSANNSDGGGIYNASGGTLTVTNSTFSGNSAASSGGGIKNLGAATLKNTIIANSPSGGDCVGALTGTNINNLIESIGSNACGLTNGVNWNIIGYDPNLGTLTGSPAYFPLNAGSRAIDAGNNTICAAAPVNNQSQNGVTRPQDGNGNGIATCDIGSYEVAIFRLYLPLIQR